MAKLTKSEYKELLLKTSAEGGFPAICSERNLCTYKSSDGKKCAAGLLIPDGHEAQTKFMIFADLMKEYPDLSEYLPEGCSIEMITRIQDAHDFISWKRTAWNHARFAERIEQIFNA